MKIKQKAPTILLEILSPDFAGKGDGAIQTVATSGIDVFAHNVETVPSLQSVVRDRRAGFDHSLHVLVEAKRAAKEAGKDLLTKTSIMLGLGEVEEEIHETLLSECQLELSLSPGLRGAGVDVVTFGQYMRPSKKHMPVHRYVLPEEFDKWKTAAEGMGFAYVASGPLVRSSYKVSAMKVIA